MHAPAPILGSMRPDGSRLMLHPADVKGRWMSARRVVFGVLIAFYVLAPFIPVGGHPMIQLDVQHRRFYLFGGTFNAQDFWMVLALALSGAFGLLFGDRVARARVVRLGMPADGVPRRRLPAHRAPHRRAPREAAQAAAGALDSRQGGPPRGEVRRLLRHVGGDRPHRHRALRLAEGAVAG